MKSQAKTALQTLGILRYAFGLRRFFATIKSPKSYDIEFASCVVSFLTDRSYTKEWFHRNRKRGAHKGWHEPSITFLLEHLACVTSRFIDVGSHLGYFSILFASIPGNRSLAIEFDPSNFEELKRGVAFQPAAISARIAIVRCGVSDAADTIDLPAKRELSPGHSILRDRRTKGAQVKVSVVTLDEVSQTYDFAPDVIKIDVEGFEASVLKGAANIVSRFKPIIIVEVHPQYMSSIGHNTSMISTFLKGHGYRMYAFDDHRSKNVSPLTEVHEITRAYDHVIVCVHENDSAGCSLLASTGCTEQ
jgi:FkbM family methyltransferase